LESGHGGKYYSTLFLLFASSSSFPLSPPPPPPLQEEHDGHIHQIQKWLQQQKVWKVVYFVSSIVGLLCYTLSSTFNQLFGKWTW